jgi:hypothetical protein
VDLILSGKRVFSQPLARGVSGWRFVTLSIICVLVVTALPYLYGYLSAPPDKQFMGIMLDVPDHGQYFSWMRELTHANLSANKLTPEPNQAIFFNLLWWGMGRLGRLLGLSYAGMFQLLRFVATILFLPLVYRVSGLFLKERLMRQTAFLVVILSSGFGWLLIVGKYALPQLGTLSPLLIYIAEPNTFLNILAYPHFIAAALYIFIFDLVLRGQAKQQLRYAVYAGLVALILGWQHAYDLVLVYGILGSYMVMMAVRDRRLPAYLIKGCFIIGIISWWPALYSAVLTSLDPLWKQVLAQFANAGVYTPNPLQLPILLGPAFLLAVFTFVADNPFRLRGLSDDGLFLKTWFLANFFLIYIPTDYQIHMLNGWQVPIAILATQGLFRYVLPFVEGLGAGRRWSWSKEKIQRWLVVGLVLIVLPTNAYLLLWRFFDLGRHDYPYYLHNEELAALTWLDTHANPDDVTLSSLTIGQYVPALTGTHAFLGHWAQTVDFYDKSAMVDEFFATGTNDARRQEILQQYSVDYVFYGPAERDLGNYMLQSSPVLQRVYTASQVEIYQVRMK